MQKNGGIKANIIKKFRTTNSVNPIIPMLGVLPIMVALLLFSLYPAVLNIVMSFTDYNGVWKTTEFVGFENYQRFWTVLGPEVLPSFLTTIKYSLMVVLPLQVIAITAALLVNLKYKSSNFFRAVFFMPSILGSAVICSAWKLLYDPNIGPFSKLLALFGKQSAFLGDFKVSLLCIVIIALWASFGYSMTIYLAGLQGIPKDYYEAADIDGAGAGKKFTKITLPLMWPSITINLWIAISGTLGMADYIMLTTKGGFNTKTIGYYIFDTVINNLNTQGQSAAVALYFFIFITTIMLLFNKFIRKKEVVM